MTAEHRPRVLLAVTFYNGRGFARRTMESISLIESDGLEFDVLVLDDASPEPGFSELLSQLASEFGAQYYRSPRNVGIPRNVNLGLATAQRLSYDYVVISNSDVIYARNSVRTLVDVALANPEAASVTAWSTNVDPYSLPNGVDLFPESQEITDRVGETLFAEFGAEALEIPAGISFAMLVPTGVLATVGLMDPIFGRGYGEESDWSARASSAGYRHMLAKGAFVFHSGRGSTLAAGIVSHTDIADWTNQHIVEQRSPMFRWNVDGFLRSGKLEGAQIRAVSALVRAAAGRSGYTVVDGAFDWETVDDDVVTVAIRSEAYELCTAHWRGFTTEIDTDSTDVLGDIRSFFDDAKPISSNIRPATWEGAARFGYPADI